MRSVNRFSKLVYFFNTGLIRLTCKVLLGGPDTIVSHGVV